jgi:hypothetical protein
MSLDRAVRDLFLAFGNVTDDRIAAFTRIIADGTRCLTCLEAACRKAASSAQRMPSPAAVIAVYNDVYGTEHIRHVGQTEVEAAASSVEAFWRVEAVKLLMPHTRDRDIASFVAAQMWWSRVQPMASHVIDQVRNPMWVDCARLFLSGRDVAYVTQRAWDRARKAATAGDDGELSRATVELR